MRLELGAALIGLLDASRRGRLQRCAHRRTETEAMRALIVELQQELASCLAASLGALPDGPTVAAQGDGGGAAE